MSLLTDDEIADAYTTAMAQALRPQDATAVTKVARAIEAAVIARLANVSVEPVVFCDDYYTFFCFSADIASKNGASIQLYSKEALAAVRVQAIEECAKVADKFSSSSQYKTQRNLAEWIAKDTRALIGGKE